LDNRTITRKLPAVKQILRSLALVVVSATVVWAGGDGRSEKTLDTTREPRISLTNLKGQVLVHAWAKAQVHVVYSVASPQVEVDTEVLPDTGAAEKIHFATHLLDPAVVGEAENADYTLDVPAGASLEIRNLQGKARVVGMQADASIESVGGSIVVSDYSGHLSVRSVGGDIEIIHPSGQVDAYTITGNLHFVSPATTRLRGSTTSGNILFEGDFMERGDYHLSAYSGNVDVVCPASASYELSAITKRGKVINTLPIHRRRQPASPLDSNSLLGTHNTGKATVELKSFSGNIRIRPQD
jgi:hypothetical protein